MRVANALPEFSKELISLISASDHPELAAQVVRLELVDRCRCGVCATFYTSPRPDGGYPPGHWNLVLTPKSGMVILDVVNRQILAVEVLEREDVRRRLLEAMP